jgi:hypothetical protein
MKKFEEKLLGMLYEVSEDYNPVQVFQGLLNGAINIAMKNFEMTHDELATFLHKAIDDGVTFSKMKFGPSPLDT